MTLCYQNDDIQIQECKTNCCDSCGIKLERKVNHPIYCKYHLKCEFCGITETIVGSVHSYGCPKWFTEYNQRRVRIFEKMIGEGTFSLEKYRKSNITFISDIVRRKNIHGLNSETKEECLICREKSANIRIKCFHYYHKGCLEEWQRISSCCPICRKKFIR